MEMFPDKQHLRDQIPEPKLLTLSKLAHDGHLANYTCSPAQLFWKLLIAEIHKIAKEEEMSEEEINVYKADCWHHL